MNQEKNKKKHFKKEILHYKKFDYIDQLTSWFNEHQEFKLIGFSLGKERTCFVCIYTDKETYYE